MTLLYEKYLAKNVIITLFFSIIVLSGIVWLTQILRLTFLIEKHVQIIEFLLLTILIIPSLLHTILPLAMVYSCLFCFNNLKNSKELIILQMAGLSSRDFCIPVLKISSFLFIISILNSSYFMPLSYGMLKTNLYNYRNTYISGILEEGVFNNISKNLVIFLSKKLTNNEIEGVILFDKRNKNLNSILIAKEAKFISKKGFFAIDMRNGSRQSFNTKGDLELMNFDKFTFTFLKENSSKREFEDKDLMELYLTELIFAKKYTSESTEKYYKEASNRITWNCMNLILPLLALSVFLLSDFNRENYTKYLLKSFFVSMIFISCHFIFLMNPILQYTNLVVGTIITYLLGLRKT